MILSLLVKLCPCASPCQDEEPRVRGAVADCVRELAQRQGSAVFDAMGQQVVGSIQAALVSALAPQAH